MIRYWCAASPDARSQCSCAQLGWLRTQHHMQKYMYTFLSYGLRDSPDAQLRRLCADAFLFRHRSSVDCDSSWRWSSITEWFGYLNYEECLSMMLLVCTKYIFKLSTIMAMHRCWSASFHRPLNCSFKSLPTLRTTKRSKLVIDVLGIHR